MPRPVFPVVRLPYDQPDRVARVLDAVRRELRASRRQTASSSSSPAAAGSSAAAMMTARVQLLQAREPEKMASAESTAAPVSAHVDQTVLDQVTVGVRDCTLTPKTRPEITVTAGGVSATRNLYHDQQQSVGAVCGGSPFLLVPPVNITAEISRPSPASLHQQYTAATS